MTTPPGQHWEGTSSQLQLHPRKKKWLQELQQCANLWRCEEYESASRETKTANAQKLLQALKLKKALKHSIQEKWVTWKGNGWLSNQKWTLHQAKVPNQSTPQLGCMPSLYCVQIASTNDLHSLASQLCNASWTEQPSERQVIALSCSTNLYVA